jgi:hypothetical protein
MEKLVDKLLGNIPKDLAFSVNLPSKGKFYKSYNPSVGVKVRPMTFKDESMLIQKNNEANFTPIDYILENCVQGVDSEELISMDILSILFKIREVSYGDNYKVTTKCPHCDTDNVLDFKMSILPINHVEDNVKDPREVLLPVTNVTAMVRFPRRRDDKGFTTNPNNVWRFVESINGCEDKAQIAEVLNDPRFPLKDMKTLLTAISLVEYGVVTEAEYSCCNEGCEKTSIVTMNIGADFFSVN